MLFETIEIFFAVDTCDRDRLHHANTLFNCRFFHNPGSVSAVRLFVVTRWFHRIPMRALRYYMPKIPIWAIRAPNLSVCPFIRHFSGRPCTSSQIYEHADTRTSKPTSRDKQPWQCHGMKNEQSRQTCNLSIRNAMIPSVIVLSVLFVFLARNPRQAEDVTQEYSDNVIQYETMGRLTTKREILIFR